jgi:hypothetical protein
MRLKVLTAPLSAWQEGINPPMNNCMLSVFGAGLKLRSRRIRIMSDQMKDELERLRAENAALKQKKPSAGTLSMKVSEKGALSIYGMGRFPVTLYKEQWLKLLTITEDIKKFIAENDDRLKTKE